MSAEEMLACNAGVLAELSVGVTIVDVCAAIQGVEVFSTSFYC